MLYTLHESPKKATYYYTNSSTIDYDAQKILSFVSIPFLYVEHDQSFYIYAGMTRTCTNNMIIYNLQPPKAHKHTHVTCTHTEKVRQEQKLFTVSLMGKSLEVDSCMELFL